MKKHSGIAIIIGTKAELIKCMSLMRELEKIKKGYWFIHTGQHPLGKACEEFSVKKPDFILSPEPKISTKFWSKINRFSILWFLLMIFKIKNKIREIKPKYVIYHGDTMSTAAASIGSSRMLNSRKKWKNVHLEAGLRSGSIWEPFPEEISRQISDRFSDILFAVSKRSENNLTKLKGKKIINTGNTIVDSAQIAYEIGKKKKIKIPKEYALINIHRHENLRSRKRMASIVEILKLIKVRAIWPLHDNTEYHLKKYGLMESIKKIKNIEITELTNYPKFIFLIANCKYLVTDGGSIQEESLVFKKPCVILRKRTERQEGLSTGINFLVGVNVSLASSVIKAIEEGKVKAKNFVNPYGKPGLSKNILNILK